MFYYEVIPFRKYRCETWFTNVSNVLSMRALPRLLDVIRMIEQTIYEDEYKQTI